MEMVFVCGEVCEQEKDEEGKREERVREKDKLENLYYFDQILTR